MIDLNDVSAFCEVAACLSFTKAAERLGVAKSSLSRRVSTLETNLGFRLFERTTRRLGLTEEGQVFFDKVSLGLNQVEEAEHYLRGLRGQPKGTLKLAAPVELGQFFAFEIIPEFLKTYPEVFLSLELNPTIRDPIEAGCDLCLRAGPVLETPYPTKTIATIYFSLFASQKLWSQFPRPQSHSDLAKLPWVLFVPNAKKGNPREAVFQHKGKEVAISIEKPVFRCNNLTAIRNAIVRGLGIGILPAMIFAEDIKSEILEPVFPELLGQESHFHFVFPSRNQLAPKVRAFIDFSEKYFKAKSATL